MWDDLLHYGLSPEASQKPWGYVKVYYHFKENQSTGHLY